MFRPELDADAIGDIRMALDQGQVLGDSHFLADIERATGEGFVDRPARVRIRTGALAGRTAELLVDPLVVPHLWVKTRRLVVTVSGDLTRAELLAVAGSLRAAR